MYKRPLSVGRGFLNSADSFQVKLDSVDNWKKVPVLYDEIIGSCGFGGPGLFFGG
jgi:hypothetical protein